VRKQRPVIENWEIIFRNVLLLCQDWIFMSPWWPALVATATSTQSYSCSR
jgi:hypothetical protein